MEAWTDWVCRACGCAIDPLPGQRPQHFHRNAEACREAVRREIDGARERGYREGYGDGHREAAAWLRRAA